MIFQILKDFYKNFADCGVRASFVFSDNKHCFGKLSSVDGPGWTACLSGTGRVCYSAVMRLYAVHIVDGT